jgi:hypothetical protein
MAKTWSVGSLVVSHFVLVASESQSHGENHWIRKNQKRKVLPNSWVFLCVSVVKN